MHRPQLQLAEDRGHATLFGAADSGCAAVSALGAAT